jgi:hypothetical protein
MNGVVPHHAANSVITVSYIYIAGARTSEHSAYEKSEAKMAELTSNNHESRKQF